MSPQLNAGGNNYIGQSPPQTVRSNENGSTSDDSDDNALNDANVSSSLFFDILKAKSTKIISKASTPLNVDGNPDLT